jgi:DNA-binding IclR family transcriptional regulator
MSISMTDTHTRQQQPQQSQSIGTVPDTLTSSGAKLIYLYLQIEEQATIDELHRDLNMHKSTLYSLLRTLTTADLVERTGTTYSYHHHPGGTA